MLKSHTRPFLTIWHLPKSTQISAKLDSPSTSHLHLPSESNPPPKKAKVYSNGNAHPYRLVKPRNPMQIIPLYHQRLRSSASWKNANPCIKVVRGTTTTTTHSLIQIPQSRSLRMNNKSVEIEDAAVELTKLHWHLVNSFDNFGMKRSKLRRQDHRSDRTNARAAQPLRGAKIRRVDHWVPETTSHKCTQEKNLQRGRKEICGGPTDCLIV